MTDFDGTAAYYASTGGGEASEPVADSTPSAGSQKVINSVKEQAFDAIANDKGDGPGPGDATDYVEERKDQMAEEAGETISPQRKQARSERLQRALATARESGDNPGGREASDASAHHEAAEDSGEDFESQLRRRDESVRVSTAYNMRVAEFTKANPDFQDTVTGVMSVFPPAEHIARHLLESPVGPQLAYAFANNIDAIEYINALPPAQALRELAQTEGRLMQQLESQRAAPPARRATRAPRPLSTPRGGSASPNFDPSTADMDTYVAKRKAGWGN